MTGRIAVLAACLPHLAGTVWLRNPSRLCPTPVRLGQQERQQRHGSGRPKSKAPTKPKGKGKPAVAYPWDEDCERGLQTARSCVAVQALLQLMETREVSVVSERQPTLFSGRSKIVSGVSQRLAARTAVPAHVPRDGVLARRRVRLHWFPRRLVIPAYHLRDALPFDSANTIAATARLRAWLHGPPPPLRIFRCANDAPQRCLASRARARLRHAVDDALAARGFGPDGRHLAGLHPPCDGSLFLRWASTPLLLECDETELVKLGERIVQHITTATL